jgi:hypothetical protein
MVKWLDGYMAEWSYGCQINHPAIPFLANTPASKKPGRSRW